jgi:hypothetical protein
MPRSLFEHGFLAFASLFLNIWPEIIPTTMRTAMTEIQVVTAAREGRQVHVITELSKPFRPLAEYPLQGLKRLPPCSFPPSDRTYLNALMIEASLMQCQEFVKGKSVDVATLLRTTLAKRNA